MIILPIKLLILFISYCTVNADGSNRDQNCPATVTAFPPEPNSQCCGVESSPDPKIFDSLYKKLDKHPWLARIEYDKNGSLKALCGGALISGRYVLTGATCVTGPVLHISSPKNILLGEYDTSHDGPDCVSIDDGEDCTEGTTRIPIEKLIPHPEYQGSNRNHWHNIALIRMERLAPYTDFIRPICLPTTDMTLRTEPFRLTKGGWGGISEPSSVKLYVDLPFVSKEKCQSTSIFAKQNITLSKGELCAGGEKGKDSCKGDSGLPLVFENNGIFEAIGIVSFGSVPCGLENVPSVYTNIYEYKSWITSNIAA